MLLLFDDHAASDSRAAGRVLRRGIGQVLVLKLVDDKRASVLIEEGIQSIGQCDPTRDSISTAASIHK